MKKPNPKTLRLQELKAILSCYRLMTVDEVESTDWGDLEIQLEGEVWRLEQELHDEARSHPEAA
jgi:hypothetical protein